MNAVLRQLDRWRLRERLVRLVWGGARVAAVLGVVLAAACAADWLVDRYSGSEGWRKTLRSTGVLAPSDPLSVGETPFGLRVAMTAGQLALAGVLGYLLLVRPWARAPKVDDLAARAEQAFPAFDHRLVTALQLNRPTADTRGMSPVLIREVTREAGEIAAGHDLASLVDYRRVRRAAAVLAPVLVLWGAFAAVDPDLADILVRRQALGDVEIPRRTHLRNVTRDVQPTGAEVVVRFEVSGEYDPDRTGTLRVVPVARVQKKDGGGNPLTDAAGKPVLADEVQPEEFYTLTNEKGPDGESTPFYSVKLPPASVDFSFQARLGAGRTREPGQVRFEAPPQLAPKTGGEEPLTAVQVLPAYLGLDPGGLPYVSKKDGWTRGVVVDALPQSKVIVDARFNKPVRTARLVPLERAPAASPGAPPEERDRPAVTPFEVSADRAAASFGFDTTPQTIGYRLELTDDLGFTNPTPIRRDVRMWEDRPPDVEFKRESTRNPDPATFDGRGESADYEWDMALGPDGLIQVIYAAESKVGVRAANIRYRVIPRGVDYDAYPKRKLPNGDEETIDHPAKDPELLVFDRLPLTRFARDPGREDLGPFVPDLGLFTYSFRNVSRFERNRVNVEFYPLPSRNPAGEPGELEAGGRRNFEVAGLLKRMPDGTRAKLAVGDTVELYVEVFDKLPGPDGRPDPARPAGYLDKAIRKTVVTEAEAVAALRARDEAKQKLQEKLRELADQATGVFRPKD